jgi:hypothetical protein
MAFFGLTALGPQEQFKAARLEAYTCELFELKEFAAAFDAVSPAGAPLPAAKLDEVFRRVFHGPLPAPEADKVARHFRARGLALSAEAEVPRLAFMQAVEALREAEAAAPFDVGEAAHYTSSEMLREHRLRQIRPQTGPEQIYTKSREWGGPGPAAAGGGGGRQLWRRAPGARGAALPPLPPLGRTAAWKRARSPRRRGLPSRAAIRCAQSNNTLRVVPRRSAPPFRSHGLQRDRVARLRAARRIRALPEEGLRRDQVSRRDGQGGTYLKRATLLRSEDARSHRPNR